MGPGYRWLPAVIACVVAAAGCGSENGQAGLAADLTASFASVGVPAACAAASDGGVPVVTVGEDRSFQITVQATVTNVVEGQNVRAEVDALRTGDDLTVTFPLVRSGDVYEGSTTLSWPKLGDAAFVVRVVGSETQARVHLVDLQKAVVLRAGSPASGPLVPVVAQVTCGQPAVGVGDQPVSFKTLPSASVLPDSGKTAADGTVKATVEVAPDGGVPLRVEATSGADRAGCTLEASGPVVVPGECEALP